ncbi:MAG: NADP-dependent glyceraldehyde-3-phosphate dehydrogenase [Acidobacteria bacterium]|nr:NADP-dependent glyceraldehyde-3-phosphate dehydrogenase [Acidobacteriota bacterium]
MTELRSASVFPRSNDIPERFRFTTPREQRAWLCNGELRDWHGALQDVLSPVCIATDAGPVQQRIGAHPLLGAAEAEETLDAATRAWANGRGEWPTMTVEGRIRCVERFTAKMQERRDEIVKLLMWEIGKSLADAEKEFDRTVVYIRDTIDALKELDRISSRLVIEEGVIGQIRRAPLGVALCMGPFNYPLNETFTTLIPALIMGNTIIFKPPKLGVLLHEPLLEAFRDSFPKGVVNTVYGDGPTVITPIMKSGRVDVLAFIGSSRVGDILKSQHPKPHRLRCVLGLEAKNAAIVLPDADLDLAVRECTSGALSYNGQRCTAIKMILVHESIAPTFLSKFCESVDALRDGMPWEPGVQITPLPEENKTSWMRGLIDDAIAKGAKVVNARGNETEATWMHPAVVYPVGADARLGHEEQFGPVVPVASFGDVDEALRFVADSSYGQQVAIFGSDPDAIAALVDPLVNQVCRVNVNSQCQRGPDTFPFTGRKDSAEGTLSVTDALRVFTIRSLVAAKATDANKAIIRSILNERSSKFLSTDFIL